MIVVEFTRSRMADCNAYLVRSWCVTDDRQSADVRDWFAGMNDGQAIVMFKRAGSLREFSRGYGDRARRWMSELPGLAMELACMMQTPMEWVDSFEDLFTPVELVKITRSKS